MSVRPSDNLVTHTFGLQARSSAATRSGWSGGCSPGSQQTGEDLAEKPRSEGHQSDADVNNTAVAQGNSSGTQRARQRSSVKRRALGFTPLRRKLQASLITPPPPPARLQNEHLDRSTCHPDQLNQGRDDGTDVPGSLIDYQSPGQFRTPAVARLPAPGQCMEAAAMDSAVPSSDVPTNQPAGTSGMRCLAVRSPQPMQARRQWGVLSLQQQAARPPEPQENSAQQPQPQQRASRGPLAEHIQNDSDFLEVPKLRGFQGAAAKRRSHWPAPVRNGRAGNAVPPTSTRSVEVEVEVAEPLEVSPEAIREGGASHGSREPAAGQPQWRRKQGHSMEPAGHGDKQSNLMSTGLQLALNKAADPADVQDAGPAADAEVTQARGDAGDDEAGSRQQEGPAADSMAASCSHPPAGMSFVPETCLPVLSLPALETVPDTPDTKPLPGARSAAKGMRSSMPAAGQSVGIRAEAQQRLHSVEGNSSHTNEASLGRGSCIGAALQQRDAEGAVPFIRFGRTVLAAVPCTSSR